MELKLGQNVNLTIGEQVKIIKEIGRGGQGIVYLVDLSGKKMALKWYLTPPEDKFYKNLERNITNGAPSKVFLWPEYLTVKENGSYGYIMKLRPQDYFEFSNYLLARKKFKSFTAMLAAAMKICNGFMMLHRHGLSYQDLNDGNFFINPDNGDVLICDNDNVMPQGEKSGIMGKARYMAPEVVSGSIPDKYSDRFSLSVILFMIFYANHPFEGAKVVACPCLTESFEKKFYGTEAVFVYNPVDQSNLPVRGVHGNLIRRWPVFPKILRDTFIREFSQENLRNPQKRLIEQEWARLIEKIRDYLIFCPKCLEETFIDPEVANNKCINCGQDVTISQKLKIGSRILPLTNGTEIFLDRDSIADAKVSTDVNGVHWIENLSPSKWMVETPSGKLKAVAPQEKFPAKPGMKVTFGSTSNPASAAQTSKGEII